jgi:hypothetical protein
VIIERLLFAIIEEKLLFEKNTDRLIIFPMSFSCNSQEEHQLVKYLKANLPIALKRRAESLSYEIVPQDTDNSTVSVNTEFLLGLMEKPSVMYAISHLLFLTIAKFQKMSIEIDGNKVSSEITDEGLKKLIKKIYERLKEEKE